MYEQSLLFGYVLGKPGDVTVPLAAVNVLPQPDLEK